MEEQKREFKGIWIPKGIWLNEDLDIIDKIILVEIDSFTDEVNNKYCFASNEYFAKFCSCSVSKVTKSIKKLKELGFIEQINFDGRTRILRSRLCFNIKQTSMKKEADSDKKRTININNNIDNKINNKENYNKRVEEQFNKFYEMYPKHLKKQEVYKWFLKNKPSDELFNLMIKQLNKFKESKQWQSTQYIPYPSTWLNQKRWEDEVLSEYEELQEQRKLVQERWLNQNDND